MRIECFTPREWYKIADTISAHCPSEPLVEKLVQQIYEKTDLFKSIQLALSQVVGAYSLVVIDKNNPQVAARLILPLTRFNKYTSQRKNKIKNVLNGVVIKADNGINEIKPEKSPINSP